MSKENVIIFKCSKEKKLSLRPKYAPSSVVGSKNHSILVAFMDFETVTIPTGTPKTLTKSLFRDELERHPV